MEELGMEFGSTSQQQQQQHQHQQHQQQHQHHYTIPGGKSMVVSVCKSSRTTRKRWIP
jgi:hypothetical protein